MPRDKLPLLQARLERRMRELGLGTIEQYSQHLHAGGEGELKALIDVVTTNKTEFYREPQHFQFLEREALPELSEHHRHDTIRLWCAGCSTGEEAYTLAMLMCERARAQRGLEFRILATDISTRVLAHAKLGIYEAAAAQPLPQAWRDRYLALSKDPRKRQVRVRAELRRRVSFHRLNFMHPSYPLRDQFDVIFFRNVAIYFEQSTQTEVVSKITQHLAAGGYFFTGLSDSLQVRSERLSRIGPSIYRAVGR